MATTSPMLTPVLSPTAGSHLDNLTTKEASGTSSRSSRSNLSIDLTSLPPLIEPSPPTNTLLITNLNNLEIFRPDHLQSLRELIDSSSPIITWAPLKSFRRIVCSFESETDALKIRQMLDGEAIMSERIRIYFGHHTPIEPPTDTHLQAPESKKLFFISPPPSPPHGWEMRNEDPPNAQVMAEDLAEALKKLSWNTESRDADGLVGDDSGNNRSAMNRGRSGSSTVILEPENATDKGGWDMPGITVEDHSDNDEERLESPMGDGYKPVVPIGSIHTARPPIETMHDV